jgi:hypothetical protein
VSTKPADKPRITIEDMESINPMIDSDGDTYKVSSALTALSCMLYEERALEPDSAENFGLSMILSTCAAALRKMQELKP